MEGPRRPQAALPLALAPLRLLLVDDEPLARLRLKSQLSGCFDVQGQPLACVVAEAGSAREALTWRDSGEVIDGVLLDVQMPGWDGMSLAAQWSVPGVGAAVTEPLSLLPPAVVFVTAHPEHAVKAFDLEAVDYLTKPVRADRLKQALHRMQQWRRVQAEGHASAVGVVSGGLMVGDRGRLQWVPWSQICYLKAEQKVVILRTRSGTHVVAETLAELEQRWSSHLVRIHRNALVARHAVRALDKRWLAEDSQDDDAGETWAVCLEGCDEWLPVSRRQVAAVREALTAVVP